MKNTCVIESLKANDYKSIALPAELQGHLVVLLIFSLINQLNQYIINFLSCSHAPHARSDSASCSLSVTNLSVWSRYGFPILYGNSSMCFYPVLIKPIGVETHEKKKHKIYNSST
jgi:hypothetical protein